MWRRSGQMKDVIQMFIELGRTADAFSEAARWGEIELVERLLEEGVPVDIRDDDGGTALMKAASGGQLAIVKLLIRAGAEVNAIHEGNGYTSLIWLVAALHACVDYVKIANELLKAGARVDIRATDGVTALDLARTRQCPPLVELLESHQ